jgi:hypothetical protein
LSALIACSRSIWDARRRRGGTACSSAGPVVTSASSQAWPADVAPDAADLGAAVEEQMTKIVTELGAALGVFLTSLGTRAGYGRRSPGPGR